MTAVILTIHTLIVIALIGVVLLQRSDGGALGLGGGGGGGFMTGRGAANALTRTTSILAAAFFATSLILAIRAGAGEDDQRVIDELTGAASAPAVETSNEPREVTTDDLLNDLGSEDAPAGEPATTEDLLNDLGVETAPAEEAPAEEAPAEEETPQE
ncbi:preprotein translocase subunit SecG [Hyphococcus sp.]|jgi:preprotein translocase subunit SecG|uniref:preprotein translocase subunit SecG n=1 Tax=Hyphococcus sp. TaxID=2038636 RepID=UPI003D122C96